MAVSVKKKQRNMVLGDRASLERKRKNGLYREANRAQKHPDNANPLIRFLAELPDDVDSRLWRVAQSTINRSFDPIQFRTNLVAKLKRLSYVPEHPSYGRIRKTFYAHLKATKALPILLHRSTAGDLWRCLLLQDIVNNDRTLETKKQSLDRKPLAFHSQFMTEIARHVEAIYRLLQKYSVNEKAIAKYASVLDREYMGHARLVLHSRYPGSRKALLGGHTNENLATEESLFRILKWRLTTKRLPDTFLYKLAKLISAPSNVIRLPSADNIRKAVERRS